jgi:hypothetical protein
MVRKRFKRTTLVHPPDSLIGELNTEGGHQFKALVSPQFRVAEGVDELIWLIHFSFDLTS